MMLQPGSIAPPFELELVSHSRPTKSPASRLNLEDVISEGPALLFFVKEACPTCRYSLPLMDRIFRNYQDCRASVVVIAQEDEAQTRGLIEDMDLGLPVLMDQEPHTVSEEYGLSFVPSLFYVNQAGKIEDSVEGFAREEWVAISGKIADFDSRLRLPFFSSGDGIPPFRPG